MRVLFLSDTHLGFDMPFRPRIKRRRRGPDFFRNFERALAPARSGEVDCVVHGGDILYRSKVPAELVAMAFEPLKGDLSDYDPNNQKFPTSGDTIKVAIWDVFTGPIKDQAGKIRVAEGKRMSDPEMLGMGWFVEKVVGQLPK